MVPITLTYGAILGLMMAVLSIRVPIRRGILDVPFGDGGDVPLATRIRAFGNFVEYVPMIVLLMALAEVSGTNPGVLHVSGMALVLSRLVHAVAYRGRSELTLAEKVGRGIGALSTWTVLFGLSAYLLLTGAFG
ncbi:MAG: MAPEG family protein [Myxococcota bacterium]